MPRTLRLLTGVLGGALALALAALTGSPGAVAEADRDGHGSGHRDGQQVSDRLPQTSDGVRGARAGGPPGALRPPEVWTTLQTTAVAPGVTYEQFLLSGGRGQVRGELMRIDPATPGLGFDLVAGRHVASRHVVADMMDPDAVVAVNGDFFDIRDTEAPLGVAKDRQRGLMNGVEDGWNSAFWVDRRGVPHIGDLYAEPRLPHRDDLDISTVNSPSVRPGGIGLYTPKWGTLVRHRVVDGQRLRVRMVVVRGGRVVANRTDFPDALRVTGQVLVGRGAGAERLSRLSVGEKVSAVVGLSQRPQMAVTGSLFLVRHGERTATDDLDLHPRTAIGIDADTGQVLLLVIDGRQSFSRGYTMVELARLFQRLGIEDALNLDGGGSSIMVARQPDGSLAVLNSPSDGHPRPVANGLEVTYDSAG